MLNGFNNWLLQRLSGVVLTIYTLFLVAYWMLQADSNIKIWQQLFATQWMKDFTLIALLAMLSHAWLGIWTVITDYIKMPWLRLTTQVLVAVALLMYLIWGIQILWS